MAGYATGSDVMLQAAKDIDNVNQETNGILTSLSGQLSSLEGAWVGSAATAFHQLMERFNDDARKLSEALQSISEQMQGSAQTYIQQEEEQSQAMSSITSRLGG
ncbi:WXG100 family type VII secretion target [Goodfellowiella coeruleoviolacea]|uniref:ESAT-6-like protein n=1 Tax=Goodfellowiella coeruleoviolacea TaxID=334858 RepID=A0AAE3GGQ1_9PSEU|nr:WXG100 family type VII secretion target [Goodfellowiella coeruleoviolacea]MCP2165808.1 WXG100 family type VII secretion target [Goodfellowiella coeruleoviolacea]